jgi:putative Holliday junction resolvase
MSVALGIDLGERRIGVALADGPGAGARPLTTLPRARHVTGDARALGELIDRHGVEYLVVGLPLEAAGQEGPQAATTRTWVDALAAVLDRSVAVTFQDERLTSHVAETRLGPMPRGRSGGPPTKRQRDAYRAKVDREAAAIILQDWLDTRREPDASSPPTPPSRSTPTTLETTR